MIPVIIAINEYLKTGYQSYLLFLPGRNYIVKIAFNNETGLASDVVAKAVQTLR